MAAAAGAVTKPYVHFQRFGSIGFQIGVLTKICRFPEARNPSYKVTVGLQNERELTSSAQLPPNYPRMEELFRRQVVTVTNLPPRKIAGFASQCLIVGFPDDNHHVHLLNTRGREAEPGQPLEMHEEAPAKIKYDVFEAADIRAATIEEMVPMEADENSYLATVNVGALGHRRVSLVDIDAAIAAEISGTQIAVVINLKPDCMQDPDTFALSFRHEGKRIPLGVDRPVENGVSLF